MIAAESRAILDALEPALVLIGPDGRVRHMNPAAVALFGEGLAARHYVAALRQPELLRCVERVMEEDETAEAEFAATVASADAFYRARCSAVPMSEGRGALLGVEDISFLRGAGQMRRDFVANVSHELRTPLTSVLGFIETLGGAARDDEKARAHFLGLMQAEAERMNRLIGDLLSLSRVEANERARPTAQVDLGRLLASTVRMLGPAAKAAGVELVLSADAGDAVVPGDEDQLTQVFTNLIDNAIKYGAKPGRVDVALSRVTHDADLQGPAVRVAVTDRGEGIADVHLPRLTERFYRVDGHRSRELGGTGLGLAIVKHIVNRHRGRLRIQSRLGEGSTFSVILPGR